MGAGAAHGYAAGTGPQYEYAEAGKAAAAGGAHGYAAGPLYEEAVPLGGAKFPAATEPLAHANGLGPGVGMALYEEFAPAAQFKSKGAAARRRSSEEQYVMPNRQSVVSSDGSDYADVCGVTTRPPRETLSELPTTQAGGTGTKRRSRSSIVARAVRDSAVIAGWEPPKEADEDHCEFVEPEPGDGYCDLVGRGGKVLTADDNFGPGAIYRESHAPPAYVAPPNQ